MSWIKEKYRQFRRWQEKPFEYHDSHGHHVCCNCGAECDNNFCPRCGLKATSGPVTWRSVWQGVLDVWGVGSRSLPYSLWQLMWRPGYMMRDYISGKRQVSFPPVKMLLLVGFAVMLIGNWVDPEEEVVVEPITSTGVRYYLDVISDWLDSHTEWFVLACFTFLVVPVWALFRYSPRCTKHTLPQGFFVQVLAASQFYLWLMLAFLVLSLLVPDGDYEFVGFTVFVVLLPIMLMVDFKQLFGFGWWGTLWRTVMTVPLGILLFRIVTNVCRLLLWLYEGNIGHHTWKTLISALDGAALLWLSMEIVRLVNLKEWRKRGWRQVLKRPMLAFLVYVVFSLAIYFLGYQGALANLFDTYISLIDY